MKILALDTASERCSVALDTGVRLLEQQLDAPTGHAEHVLGMVDALLREGEVTLAGLDAIAFGRGPGSFTGVRLAASVVQGLAFGAGRPVVPISNLLAIGQQVLDVDPGLSRVLVCHDARMGEVYWCAGERDGTGLIRAVTAERVSAPADVVPPPDWGASGWMAVGTALGLHPALQALVSSGPAGGPRDPMPGGWTDVAFLPRAREILKLARVEVAAGRVRSAHEAVPVYLRDNVARLPRAPKSVS